MPAWKVDDYGLSRHDSSRLVRLLSILAQVLSLRHLQIVSFGIDGFVHVPQRDTAGSNDMVCKD